MAEAVKNDSNAPGRIHFLAVIKMTHFSFHKCQQFMSDFSSARQNYDLIAELLQC